MDLTFFRIVMVKLIICTIFLAQDCELADDVQTNATNLSEKEDLLTECTLPDGKSAFCVSIYDCTTLLKILNATALRARICGPLHVNRRKPRVCCEKYLVKQVLDNVTLTTTVKPPSFAPNCGIQQVDTRIVGGDPTSQGEFPWMARILTKGKSGDIFFSCTGSLIASRVVLTAAHCLLPSEDLGELHAVSLGEHNITCEHSDCLSDKQTIIISETLVHPGYNQNKKNYDNDIGLIFLSNEVTITKHVSPICLLETNTDVFEYFISGWGKTEKSSHSKLKLKTSLPPFAWDQCAEKYKTIEIELTERQICAGGVKGQDSCQGDSGGPLMILRNETKWFVAGVVSFGLGCGKYAWPGIYVNVPSYSDWIAQSIQDKLVNN